MPNIWVIMWLVGIVVVEKYDLISLSNYLNIVRFVCMFAILALPVQYR